MQLDDFLDRLERVHKSGAGYKARCPAHEDRAPSLSIMDDEQIVFHCHAGCDQEAVLDAMGLEWKDIMRDEDQVEARYDYEDEDGNVLFSSVRFFPKKFRQGHQDSTGEFLWNMDGVRRVPYRLPEIVKAVQRGATVYVVEGEKDVESLRALGKAATCNPGGAGKWKDEYSAYLAGANVVIVRDKDEPGKAHAQQVKQSLDGIAKQVWVVEALNGKDASDHLAAHEIEAFVPVTDGDEPSMLPIKSVKDFAASITPYDLDRDYLGPFLHGGHRIHVAGPTGHGKTSFMLEAESAALRGEEFLGWRGRGNLRALHIDLEMPEELLNQAFMDARANGAEGLDLMHLPDGLEIDKNERDRKMIEQAIEGYDIVCIDPWYKLVGNELEYSAARTIIGLLDGLRKKHPRMCMMIGFHTQEPFNKEQRLNMASLSGFKFWHRPADVVLTFHRLHGNSSRVVWTKNRSSHLEVDVDEEWSLEWTRGQGFRRVMDVGSHTVPFNA